MAKLFQKTLTLILALLLVLPLFTCNNTALAADQYQWTEHSVSGPLDWMIISSSADGTKLAAVEIKKGDSLNSKVVGFELNSPFRELYNTNEISLGGPYRDRTGDLIHAMDALYQLLRYKKSGSPMESDILTSRNHRIRPERRGAKGSTKSADFVEQLGKYF